MKIAIPEWKDHVSPVFDSADNFLLFEVKPDSHEPAETMVLPVNGPLMRASILRAQGVQLLICGAISHMSERALSAKNIEIIPYKCGEIHDVVTAFQNGLLETETYSMPGCHEQGTR